MANKQNEMCKHIIMASQREARRQMKPNKNQSIDFQWTKESTDKHQNKKWTTTWNPTSHQKQNENHSQHLQTKQISLT